MMDETSEAGAVDVDVAIVGAGLSGLSMAAHLRRLCPGRRFVLLERRARIGGTWDLFRYPGVRSDSDMHTLGFAFAPWRHGPAIASGAAIRCYLDAVADSHAIRPHIRTGTRVLAADWDSAAARWTLTLEDGAGRPGRLTARWLTLASGYYDYDQAHDPGLPGLATFAGTVVHPQFWPGSLDLAGKRVVVIGSGATAVSLVPALAQTAAHVTMLQRTPTWYYSASTRDLMAGVLKALLPARAAAALIRARNVWLQDLLYKRARRRPAQVAAWLTARLRRELGAHYNARDFTPPYGPWEQRLCFVPDGDLFAALRSGRASVATAGIAGIEPAGVRLDDGRLLEADAIVTATGLKLAFGGHIALRVDGARLRLSRHVWYKGCMLSDVPNLSAVFGYLNASWTLRADLVAGYVCRVLDAMARRGAAVAVPVPPADPPLPIDTSFAFTSGYLRRAMHLFPRNAHAARWRLGQDYRADRRFLHRDPVEDGVLQFRPAGKGAPSP